MPASPDGPDAPTVGVVLPGGGARGAFEAGALSVLLPALEARGERITVICGTSVGAINAAMLGSLAHLPAAEQARGIVERWRSLRKGDVITRLVGPGTPLMLLHALAELLELPGLRLRGLMNPAPLRASLDRWVDWGAVQRNVRARRVSALCVVATSLDAGRPVGFVAGRRPLPRSGHRIRYVPVTLSSEHVRASAAIPLLFPPVRVTRPRVAAGHYIDGGTRLNAPIAPAIALGAERIIVIGLEPVGAGNGVPVIAPSPPRLADVVANVLDGLLVDQVGHDVRRMLAVNSFLVEGVGSGPAPRARAYRTARGRPPYRRIAHVLVAPERRGTLGAIAERVLAERHGGWNALRDPDFLVLARLLGGGRARARGELLSFLFFEEAFAEALIAAGREAAQAWLARHPGLWSTADDELSEIDARAARGLAEEATLDEYRALRRR